MSPPLAAIEAGPAEPPRALQAHALLVLVASFVYAHGQPGYWWSGPVLVALVLWPLLRGSRFAWWVGIIAISASVVGLASAWAEVSDPTSGASVFLAPTTVIAVGTMLVAAWLLLTLPRVREFCGQVAGPSNAVGFGLGVLLISQLSAMAFSPEARLPTTRMYEDTSKGKFVGADEEHRIAFYVDREPGMVCLVTIEPQSASRSCERRSDLARPDLSRSDDLIAQLIAEDVARVEVIGESGTVQEAEMIAAGRVPAKVFYVTDPPPLDERVQIRGYDAAGEELFLVR